MKKVLKFILGRLKEPSTYRGIALILTAAGINIAPELMTEIVSVGMGTAGIIGVVTKDKKEENK